MSESYAEWRRRTLRLFLAAFFLLAAAIAFFACRSYRKFESQSFAEMEALLATVNSARLQALAEWRVNLLNHANLIYRNAAFSETAARYLKDPRDEAARADLLAWLEAYEKNEEIAAAALLDSNGRAVLSVPAAAETGFPAAREIPRALASQEIVFVDFYRAIDDETYLAMLVPARHGDAAGIVFLQIDPRARLYPLLAAPVTQNPQPQSFLARREANGAVILSPLKFKEDAPLLLRMPLGETQNIAVQAVLGKSGSARGSDYRGVEMLADIQPVPRFPWTLVTHISMNEVYAPVWENFGRAAVVSGTLFFYLGLGALLIWRQRQLKYYQAEAQAAEVLRKTEEELRQLTRELDQKVRERTEQLRALSQQMVETQERQIKNLASELHDRIGQNLTAINIQLSLVSQLLPKNASAALRARLTDAAQLVEETVARMRNLAAEFLPPMLEHYGLAAALTWYGEQFEARANIRVEVKDGRSQAARLPPEVEVGLFRVAQEALNNVAKHARASRVLVELRDEDGFALTIADDGIGFDPQTALNAPGHWGFAIMRERASAAGASFTAESAPGAGTKITLRIPK